MIQRKLDLVVALAFVMYGRMSDPKQNKSSPDQQFREIQERIVRSARNWKELKRYRDDGISGRKTKQRVGFQTMLREIETGVVKPQLILVDTLGRERRGKTRCKSKQPEEHSRRGQPAGRILLGC